MPGDASLEQIRDAYRRKSKMLHPDVGRRGMGVPGPRPVLRDAQHGPGHASDPCRNRRPRATRGARGPPRARAERRDRPRRASTTRTSPADRLIAVEHLCVRYLWDDAAYLWLVQKQSDEERFLSCSLNLTWPDQGLDVGACSDEGRRADRRATLSEIFDHMVVSTRVDHARDRTRATTQFAGWLSYSSFDRSWKALKCLHDAARSRGLGLRQWSRDLFIPKNWS